MSEANGSSRPWGAIGVFDGVHLGHCAMLGQLCATAHEHSAPAWAVSFDPHPRAVLTGTAPPLLCTVQERVARLLDAGVEHVELLPFDEAMRDLEPEAFVRTWLHERLDLGGIVVGRNFRFGRGAAGDVALLRDLGSTYDIDVRVAPIFERAGARVSSSRIRGLLDAGDVAGAHELLGRPHMATGTVVRGAQRGRELGMPTANIAQPPELALPVDGVYAGVAQDGDERWIAAISLGTNPQFHDPQQPGARSLEAHLLDYDGGPDSLYGHVLTVEFHEHVRQQLTFDSVDALVERMWADVDQVRAAIGEVALRP